VHKEFIHEKQGWLFESNYNVCKHENEIIKIEIQAKSFMSKKR